MRNILMTLLSREGLGWLATAVIAALLVVLLARRLYGC